MLSQRRRPGGGNVEAKVTKFDSLGLDLGKDQPAVVPASGAGWISNDFPFGGVQQL